VRCMIWRPIAASTTRLDTANHERWLHAQASQSPSRISVRPGSSLTSRQA
jgi:hypothetical protein